MNLLPLVSFAMRYQPIWDMQLKQVMGYEATVCGVRGEPAATMFRQHAHDIVSFDTKLICRAVYEGVQLLQGNQMLFINVHPKTLAKGVNVPLWQGQGHNHQRIVFEITEKTQITGAVKAGMLMLQNQGFNLAVDDFGKQYSNLDRLLNDWFQPAFLKLDRSFVSAVELDHAQLIVKHTSDLCQKLGIKLICEGVETAHQLELLLDCGVRYVQGYHLGYPEYASVYRGGIVNE
ncbi:EAL domain-containing protein [Paenibacillus pinisoli]|nr:EAL domain-containing protein [Paenibacillus pinisoli]